MWLTLFVLLQGPRDPLNGSAANCTLVSLQAASPPSIRILAVKPWDILCRRSPDACWLSGWCFSIHCVAQLSGIGYEPAAPGGRGKDARSALGLVLQNSVRRKVKTIVLHLEVGYLLEQSHKRRFRPDTDNPILGHVDEHLFEQQA